MPVLAISLFLLAAIGHGYLLMLSINAAYSQPYDRILLKLMRSLWGILLVAGPPLFGVLVGFNLITLGREALESSAQLAPAAYAWLCVMAGGAFLIATIKRLLRRQPAVVLEERSERIDVEKELGHRPIGEGRHHGLASLGFNDLCRVEFATLTLKVPGLPAAWDGLTILHLSDLHFYGSLTREFFDFVIGRCMREPTPDLFVLSGDIIDGPQYLEWIEPVLKPLQWNVAALAILGNHDWWQDAAGVRQRLAGLGMRVLGNRWETIDVRGERLVAIGHEGPWFRPPPDLTGCPNGFRLLVSHTPDNIRWARKHNCRLMLSGHNHGGQIRVPVIGSMFVPSKYSRRYDMGTFHEPPTIMHVNRGLGCKAPLRIRAYPQVSRIVLRVG
ncbi:MAG TPA: metallophosphoesterase [Gemmataceae bacterium]|jgi:hypothetical protein|nr:metallophosphoesterase [Gemmataceae bacterium]